MKLKMKLKMKEFTIYCTEEQTKKAFELGAPIITLPNYEEYKDFPFVRCGNGNEYPCIIPTAEQMLGWLESQKEILDINISLYEDDGYPRMCGYSFDIYDRDKNIIVGTFTEKGNLVYMDPISRKYIYLVGTYYNDFLTKNEATLAAIDAALDYLIDNKK